MMDKHEQLTEMAKKFADDAAANGLNRTAKDAAREAAMKTLGYVRAFILSEAKSRMEYQRWLELKRELEDPAI